MLSPHREAGKQSRTFSPSSSSACSPSLSSTGHQTICHESRKMYPVAQAGLAVFLLPTDNINRATVPPHTRRLQGPLLSLSFLSASHTLTHTICHIITAIAFTRTHPIMPTSPCCHHHHHPHCPCHVHTPTPPTPPPTPPPSFPLFPRLDHSVARPTPNSLTQGLSRTSCYNVCMQCPHFPLCLPPLLRPLTAHEFISAVFEPTSLSVIEHEGLIS